MVVCDGSLMFSLVASVMMDGLCGLHNHETEERHRKEQREELRKAINVEWQRQKLMEKEKEERELRERGLDAGSILGDERRRMLLAAKAMAAQHAANSSKPPSRASSVCAGADDDGSVMSDCTSGRPDERSPCNKKSRKYQLTNDDKILGVLRKKNVSRTRSAPQDANLRSSGIPFVVQSPSFATQASLFDEDSDSENEDEGLYDVFIS